MKGEGRRASTFGIKGTLQHESAWPGRPASVDQTKPASGPQEILQDGRRNFGACIYENFQRVDGVGLALCYIEVRLFFYSWFGFSPLFVHTRYMAPIIIFPCYRPNVSLHRASFFSCF